MASITLDRVCKKFNNVTVITEIDLEIIDHEFLVLVGPSGCGKSTLLRMIAGLEEVTEGSIRIGDKDVSHLPPKDRDIAMVFQSYALYPHMNVYDNLAFGLKLHGIPKSEIERRVSEVGEMLGLKELLTRKPKHLSGGQRQRVALGRAIVREPQAFLMDEPLSNLDAKLRIQMRAELKKLHSSLRATTVYVTHDQVEAMTLGERVVILNQGKIQQIGTPEEVYNRPANVFVASFIGAPQINLFSGELTADEQQIIVRGNGFEVKLPCNQFNSPEGLPKEVLIGVRPEHLIKSANKTLPHQFSLSATVDYVENIGSESYVYAFCNENKACFRTAVKDVMETGELVQLQVDISNIRLFSKETGIAFETVPREAS